MAGIEPTIFIAAGMQKAGTAWHVNLVNQLLIRAGHPHWRDTEARRRWWPPNKDLESQKFE
jgi:hypothetical protein